MCRWPWNKCCVYVYGSDVLSVADICSALFFNHVAVRCG